MNAYRGFPIIVRIKDFYNPFLFLKGVGDFLKIYETGWGWESIVDQLPSGGFGFIVIYLIPEGKDINKSPRCIKAFTLHEMDELEEHLLKYDKAHAKGEFRYDVEPKEGGEDE